MVGVSFGCDRACSDHRGNNAGQISEKCHSYNQFAYEGFDSHLIKNRNKM
ncbi:hypothetical protein IC582_020659 [Cucumis melo]